MRAVAGLQQFSRVYLTCTWLVVVDWSGVECRLPSHYKFTHCPERLASPGVTVRYMYLAIEVQVTNLLVAS